MDYHLIWTVLVILATAAEAESLYNWFYNNPYSINYRYEGSYQSGTASENATDKPAGTTLQAVTTAAPVTTTVLVTTVAPATTTTLAPGVCSLEGQFLPVEGRPCIFYECILQGLPFLDQNSRALPLRKIERPCAPGSGLPDDYMTGFGNPCTMVRPDCQAREVEPVAQTTPVDQMTTIPGMVTDAPTDAPTTVAPSETTKADDKPTAGYGPGYIDFHHESSFHVPSPHNQGYDGYNIKLKVLMMLLHSMMEDKEEETDR